MASVFWLGTDKRLLYAMLVSTALGMMLMTGILTAEMIIEGQKGGPAIDGSVNVPLNMDCAKQSERPTTVAEYKAKLEAAGFLPADAAAAIITHCGSGGRGGKAAEHLCDAGFEAYNGGGPAHIAAARVYEMTESGELPPYTPPMP